MFCAGLEIDLALFRRARKRVMSFSLLTTGLPLLLGTLSLVVFAISVSTFQKGFSVPELALQLVEIAIFVPLILFTAVHDKPAKEKLKFFGDSLFSPIVFVATRFLIDPREFTKASRTTWPSRRQSSSRCSP